MADFVVYHSPDRMGYSADTVRGFSILTNKNVPSVVGSRVWLLTGEGTPRTYYLRGHFTPNNAVAYGGIRLRVARGRGANERRQTAEKSMGRAEREAVVRRLSTFTIKGISDDLYRRLKERAVAHRRSLNGDPRRVGGGCIRATA